MTAYRPPPEGSWHPPTEHAITPEDRNWAMAAHVGSLVSAWLALGLFAPLLVLLLKGESSPYVRRHAVESLNFQLNALVYIVVFALLIFVLVGLVLLPLYGIFYLVVVVVATMRASSGDEYRYPLTVRLIS